MLTRPQAQEAAAIRHALGLRVVSLNLTQGVSAEAHAHAANWSVGWHVHGHPHQQWGARQDCFATIRRHEAKRGRPYETYVRLRLDTLLLQPVPLELRDAVADAACGVFVPTGEDYGGLNDRLLIGGACGYEADAATSRFIASVGDRHVREAWSPERAHAESLKAAGASILRAPLALCLLGLDGACRFRGELALSAAILPSLLSERPHLCGTLLLAEEHGCDRTRTSVAGAPLIADGGALAADPGFCQLQAECQRPSGTPRPPVMPPTDGKLGIAQSVGTPDLPPNLPPTMPTEVARRLSDMAPPLWTVVQSPPGPPPATPPRSHPPPPSSPPAPPQSPPGPPPAIPPAIPPAAPGWSIDAANERRTPPLVTAGASVLGPIACDSAGSRYAGCVAVPGLVGVRNDANDTLAFEHASCAPGHDTGCVRNPRSVRRTELPAGTSEVTNSVSMNAATPAPISGTESRTSIAFGDYDNDGLPDVFLGNLGPTNQLWRNLDGVSFAEVTAASLGKATSISEACACASTTVSHVAWGDFDNDGWIDAFVGNAGVNPFLIGAEASGEANQLHRNNQDGSFSAMTGVSFTTGNASTLAIALADFDNDGWLDVLARDSHSACTHHCVCALFSLPCVHCVCYRYSSATGAPPTSSIATTGTPRSRWWRARRSPPSPPTGSRCASRGPT